MIAVQSGKESMPKISIIIPVYNTEKYLRRCLDSVFAQTFRDFEVICVNDCSQDASLSILREYEKMHSGKMTVIENEKNIGQGLARKKAMDLCESEYIAFVDSDDYIASDYLETYVKAMESHACDVAVAGVTREVDGKYTKKAPPTGVWSVLTYPISCAKMFRTAFLKENNIHFSDIRRGEDIYFGLAQFYHGIRMYSFSYYGYYYCFNRNSVTGSLTYDKEHEKEIAEIFDKFLRDYDISKLSVSARECMEYTYLANMVNALVTYGHGCKPEKMKKKYGFFMSDLKERFPDYKKNSLFGFFRPEGQTLKIRMGVGITMLAHKLGLDGLLFYLVSLW